MSALEERTQIHETDQWWTLTAVCLAVFMLLLDITIVNVALPDIQTSFSASPSDLQWVIDSYALSLAALLLMSGSLADLYGRRRLFILGLVVFTLGSISCGAATNLTMLMTSRAFQGIGGAIMFATALALLDDAFTGKQRGTAFGIFGATTGVSVAIGPVLGGALTSSFSWRWIFYVNVPVCSLALLVAIVKVHESRQRGSKTPDWVGCLTFSAALLALVYGLITAGEDGWSDTKVLALLAIAAILLVAFAISQKVNRQAMFDLALLKNSTFTGGLIAAFCVSASIFSVLTYLIIYVQNVLGYSPVDTGLRFLFLSGASFIAAAPAGRLAQRIDPKWLIAPGFLILGLGLLLMRGIAPDSSWTHLIPGMVVCGVGIGLINAPLAATAVAVVIPEKAGVASGANSTLRQVGIATGIATLGSIFSQQVGDKVRTALAGRTPSDSVDKLVEALGNGQVERAARAAEHHGGAQAYTVVHQIGTQAVVDSLNHILLLAAVVAFVAGSLSLLLIRQKDFLDRGTEQIDR